MDINLIYTKPNEYIYLNDIKLTVIEIISKESELKFLNKEFEKYLKIGQKKRRK